MVVKIYFPGFHARGDTSYEAIIAKTLKIGRIHRTVIVRDVLDSDYAVAVIAISIKKNSSYKVTATFNYYF